MKNLAIIPARSGSKGLKDKNIKLLNGKPMISYTIEAALKSNLFSEVMVSTDSAEYAEIAKKYGAEFPFFRTKKNSTEGASSWKVVIEVLAKYVELGIEFDTVSLLQPTSPLRDADDIVEGYNLFYHKNANSVIGVCEAEHSPLLFNQLENNLSMSNFISDDVINKPRQELTKYYRINGALYIIKVKDKMNIENLYDEKSFAYIMPQEKSVDIDTEIDFKFAEMLIKMKK